MGNAQQDEVIQYFRTHAREWKQNAQTSAPRELNILQQRNGFVIEVIEERPSTSSILDVGCGTGELVCETAKLGINSIGVDIAQEMVELASKRVHQEQLTKASFECCSIFDFDFSPQQFDVISANGFIEYISQDELVVFFNLVYNALTPNGSFVVGSRNRLFNMISLNSFTQMELEGPDVTALLQESILLASGFNIAEKTIPKVASLQKPNTHHIKTGIDVTTRFQYTPLQLINLLISTGFQYLEIYPIHIHGVSPLFKANNPHIHSHISNLLQTQARNSHELLPYASSFMLHMQKKT
jgi:2-polyprenyl-3-methyl-5-hydroxy-6-metoxy-1,4-benzoquinol methylase